jgi:UDP-N-acetyl-D-glucosamine dehydrogenase
MMTNNSNIVAIIGQGYVGLPLAMTLVESNWRVFGVDKDQVKIKKHIAGVSSVEDVQSKNLIRALSSGNYIPTTDFKSVSQANVIIFCVPTPLNQDHKPDISILVNAIREASPHITNGSLIISESTSYPGTLRDVIVKEVLNYSPNLNKNFYFAISPERVNPGDLIWSQKNTPRLVAGLNRVDTEKAVHFYSSFCDNVISVDSPEIAEAAKLLENTFRLINIAAINEFAQICNSANLDVNAVIDAATTKPYGFMPFRPSAGIGGHCIPVDPIYLSEWVGKLGQKFDLLTTAIDVNRKTPVYIAKRVMQLVNNHNNPKILILGVGYKKGLGDTRESPAKEIINTLENFGFRCEWFDPLVSEWEKTRCLDLNNQFGAAVLVTNQPGIDITPLLKNKIPILDCTNSFNNVDGIIPL